MPRSYCTACGKESTILLRHLCPVCAQPNQTTKQTRPDYPATPTAEQQSNSRAVYIVPCPRCPRTPSGQCTDCELIEQFMSALSISNMHRAGHFIQQSIKAENKQNMQNNINPSPYLPKTTPTDSHATTHNTATKRARADNNSAEQQFQQPTPQRATQPNNTTYAPYIQTTTTQQTTTPSQHTRTTTQTQQPQPAQTPQQPDTLVYMTRQTSKLRRKYHLFEDCTQLSNRTNHSMIDSMPLQQAQKPENRHLSACSYCSKKKQRHIDSTNNQQQ